MNLGIGFNPIFFEEKDLLPHFINFIECGPGDLDHFINHPLGCNTSVHIARPPICEDSQAQKIYLQRLHDCIKEYSFVSVGFHVIGPRLEGIGKFGFSSHFVPTKYNEQKATSFIQRAQDCFQKPIWIENVNFYSKNKSEVFRTLESINTIAYSTNSKIIADLTHLFVDAHNVGIDETALIGSVDWGRVVEVHLAGTINSRDGVMHDGHSQAVPLRVWKLFEKIVDYRLVDVSTIITVEHTDPAWISKSDLLVQDYKKALSIFLRLKDNETGPYALQPEHYASGYVRRKVLQRFPDINDVLSSRNLELNQIIADWFKYLKDKGLFLVISKHELEMFGNDERMNFYGDSFVEYCNERLQL